MKNGKVVNLEIQLNGDLVKSSVNDIASSITALAKTVASLGTEIANMFSSVCCEVKEVIAEVGCATAPITELSESLKAVSEVDFNILTTALDR